MERARQPSCGRRRPLLQKTHEAGKIDNATQRHAKVIGSSEVGFYLPLRGLGRCLSVISELGIGMRPSTSRHLAGAAAAALAAILWASAAAAAPAKLCSLARGWVDSHCGGAKPSRLATPARCERARAWLDKHCAATAAASAERADTAKAKDDKAYKADRYASPPPRHHKHAHKAHTRVYASEERPRRCCQPTPAVYYRQPRYKDVVFPVEFVPKPGWERAFYSLHERRMH